MELKLRDKVAIVTGGGRGIGEAICLALSEEGAKVVVSDIDFSAAEVTAEKLEESGTLALAMKTDVSKQAEVSALIKGTVEKLGGIDILVNNAGISPKRKGGPIRTWEIVPDEWREVISVNLEGTLFCSQEAVKFMLPKKSGSIINISSIAGKAPIEPMPTGAHYNASKAGIINLTQKMAHELAGHGIRINAIAPGRIATPLAKLASKESNDRMLERTPMGRFGEPREIANLVLFLASDVSGYITGETININGGWFMD